MNKLQHLLPLAECNLLFCAHCIYHIINNFLIIIFSAIWRIENNIYPSSSRQICKILDYKPFGRLSCRVKICREIFAVTIKEFSKCTGIYKILAISILESNQKLCREK